MFLSPRGGCFMSVASAKQSITNTNIETELLNGKRKEIEQLIGSTSGQLYFFERLNLSSNYLDYVESKTKFLRQILEANKIKEIENIWGLSLETIEEIQNEKEYKSDFFFIGYLIKYDQNCIEIARTRFFLEVESGLIAYHLVQNQINDKQFRQHFCRIIKDTSMRLSIEIKAEIYPLDKDGEHLLTDMSNLKILSKVEIYLHPSNPSPSWAFQKIDERLHELGVDNAQETLSANPGRSISQTALIKDSDFRSKVLMASVGYGLVVIIGLLQESLELVSMSTGDRPIVALVMEEAKNTLRQLVNVFISLKQREHESNDEQEQMYETA